MAAPRPSFYQQQQHGYPSAPQPFVNSHGGPPANQYFNHPNQPPVYGGHPHPHYPQQSRGSSAGTSTTKHQIALEISLRSRGSR